jgi:hypothetical protein
MPVEFTKVYPELTGIDHAEVLNRHGQPYACARCGAAPAAIHVLSGRVYCPDCCPGCMAKPEGGSGVFA